FFSPPSVPKWVSAPLLRVSNSRQPSVRLSQARSIRFLMGSMTSFLPATKPGNLLGGHHAGAGQSVVKDRAARAPASIAFGKAVEAPGLTRSAQTEYQSLRTRTGPPAARPLGARRTRSPF